MRREFVAMLWFKLIRELEWGALGRQPPGAEKAPGGLAGSEVACA